MRADEGLRSKTTEAPSQVPLFIGPDPLISQLR